MKKQTSHQKEIRVIQIIDSLDAGGGERMAVNLANSLRDKVNFSGLVVTRREGALLSAVNQEVTYCFLNKKKKIDLKALKKLVQFIQLHDVSIIHAHSTSLFTATLVKLLKPNLKLIWHDHYGESEALNQRPQKVIKIASYFFDGIFSVNQKLKEWAQRELNCRTVAYIKNFSQPKPVFLQNKLENSLLKGVASSFQIVHVANLRVQKDHLNAIKAVKRLRGESIQVNLHLIGAFQEDDYYYNIVESIKKNHLGDSVFIYGSQPDVPELLQQANLGLLSSRSEGLPLSLLEYAKAGLPVVLTDVGQCKEVVGDNAQVVPKNNPDLLAKAINYYMEHPLRAKQDADRLNKKVEEEYGEQKIINSITEVYKKVLSG